MKSGRFSPLLFIVFGVIVGLLGFFLILANPFGWKTPVPRLTTTQEEKTPSSTDENLPPGITRAPTPYLVLPSGKQTYNARGGEDKKSRVTSITYDPLDPALNSNQTISAQITSSEPIKSVVITVNTDNRSTPHTMSLLAGSFSSGTWVTSFKVTDTYEKKYDVSFEITTELGNKTTMPMLIR